MRKTIRVSGDWVLTTDRPESCYGVPVLVNEETQEGYGPGDIIEGENIAAAEFVRWHIDGAESELVEFGMSFVESLVW